MRLAPAEVGRGSDRHAQAAKPVASWRRNPKHADGLLAGSPTLLSISLPCAILIRMANITYTKGDATQPQGNGNKIIAHICNDLGGWGKGFVLAISKRWERPETSYRAWHRSKNDFGLGSLQLVQVEPYIWVANMVAQRGMKTGSKGPPIRYEAVRICLKKLAVEAKALKASVHMPRIGCGLAGGRWEEIEPIIADELAGIEVTVYDFG